MNKNKNLIVHQCLLVLNETFFGDADSGKTRFKAAYFPVGAALFLRCNDASHQRPCDKGRAIFKAKGCTACHAYGRRLTGPDLKGVTQRRTVKWMEQQILHPEIMTKQDPISRALMAEYALQMSNQGLTSDEATAVIEHLKWLDDSTGVVQQAAK